MEKKDKNILLPLHTALGAGVPNKVVVKGIMENVCMSSEGLLIRCLPFGSFGAVEFFR